MWFRTRPLWCYYQVYTTALWTLTTNRISYEKEVFPTPGNAHSNPYAVIEVTLAYSLAVV